MNSDVLSKYKQIDTPSLLIDKQILLKNIADMQKKCDAMGIKLRPHTKTHKSPDIAKMQLAAGCSGITVAKAGEAEVMAEHGIKDIFIANEVVGRQKLERLALLSGKVKLSFAVDSIENIHEIDEVFGSAGQRANILIEIETGENRCGVTSKEYMKELLNAVGGSKNIDLLGVCTHEGFTYKAKSKEHCLELFVECQKSVLEYAAMAKELCKSPMVVSVGATPTAWHATSVLDGITELRPGTYALMDVGQANALNDFSRCAATILLSVISKPTADRVVCDAGAKGLTMQKRPEGICRTDGFGSIVGSHGASAAGMYDEHLIINDKDLCAALTIGDKIEVIPNHICPVCNLYDELVLVENGKIDRVLPVACRGMLK